MKLFRRIALILLLIVATTRHVQAVPPPDFIFSAAGQLINVFAFIFVFLGAAASAVWQVSQRLWGALQHKVLVVITSIILLGGVSFAGAYGYLHYQQNKAYDQWVAESGARDGNRGLAEDDLDQLNPSVSPRPFESPAVDDPEELFLRTYYEDIASHRFEKAYAVSKQTVPFETFRDWYRDITALDINGIQKIADHKYSLRLDLYEGAVVSYYAVLTEVGQDEFGMYKIANSDVKVLEAPQVISPVFDTPVEITNTEFQEIVNKHEPYTVLDAREDEEYGYGHLPGSLHIRFADLKAGQWVQLPGDQVIYVMCWSGIRGREVAEFLRSKHINARYVQEGANGWTQAGGVWEGELSFTSRYPQERFKTVFSTQEMRAMIDSGTITVVDSREPAKYAASHIPGSINIPIIYTPTSRLEEVLSQVVPGASVVAVCDDFVNCFDAKIAGVKLESRGAHFLGRYNRPWEY